MSTTSQKAKETLTRKSRLLSINRKTGEVIEDEKSGRQQQHPTVLKLLHIGEAEGERKQSQQILEQALKKAAKRDGREHLLLKLLAETASKTISTSSLRGTEKVWNEEFPEMRMGQSPLV